MTGIQSSGKSTFQNSLFNLHFTVRNDKATRGSYAVMLPVDPDSASGHALEFVILVDTESLGSPEDYNKQLSVGESLGTHSRDSKLLLFNMGISGVSMVNSMRQFRGEMIRVLQVLMRILFRLRDCRANPLTSFVFQGVESQQKTLDALRQSSVQTLMGQFLEINGCSDGLHRFEDLMGLEDQLGVFAVPSTGGAKSFSAEYKERVQQFKRVVLSDRVLFNRRKTVSLASFAEKLQNMSHLLTYNDYLFNDRDVADFEHATRRILFKVDMREHVREMVRGQKPARVSHSLDDDQFEELFTSIKFGRDSSRRRRFGQRLVEGVNRSLLDRHLIDRPLGAGAMTRYFSDMRPRYRHFLRHVLDELRLNSQASADFLGERNRVDDLYAKFSGLLNNSSTGAEKHLDQYYNNAIQQRFIAKGDPIEKYFLEIEHLIRRVAELEWRSSRPRASAELYDLQAVESMCQAAWDKFDDEMLRIIDSDLEGDRQARSFESFALDFESDAVHAHRQAIVALRAQTQTRLESCIEQEVFDRVRSRMLSEWFLQTLRDKLAQNPLLPRRPGPRLNSDFGDTRVLGEYLRERTFEDFPAYLALKGCQLQQESDQDFHSSNVRWVRRQLSLDRMLEWRGSGPSQSFDARLLLELIEWLYKRVIDKFAGLACVRELPNRETASLRRRYFEDLVLFSFWTYKRNYRDALERFRRDVERVVRRPKDYSFHRQPMRFKNLSWQAIYMRFYFATELYIQKMVRRRAQVELDQLTEHAIRARASAVISPDNCVRVIQRRLL